MSHLQIQVKESATIPVHIALLLSTEDIRIFQAMLYIKTYYLGA